MSTKQKRLSNFQIELLKLFENNISDKDLFEIKLLLSQYFAEKATEAIDRFLDENGIDEETLIKWSHEHNRFPANN